MKQFLDGLDLTLSASLSQDHRRIFTAKACLFGAKVCVGYAHPNTTHLICTALSTREINEDDVCNMQVLSALCKCTSPTWLSECLRRESLIDETEYLVAGPPPSLTLSQLNAIESVTYERLPAYECQRRVKYGDTKNQALSDLFKGIANYYETMKAYLQPIEWIKEAPYRHAAASLYACPFEISLDNVHTLHEYLPGINTKLEKKIEEYLSTGTIQQIEKLYTEKYRVVRMFTKVLWVGSAVAKDWYDKGYRTLEEVTENEELQLNQELGIKYYDDFLLSITLDERKQYSQLISDAIETLPHKPHWLLGGSARRGKPEGHDLDYVFYHVQDLFTLTSLVEALKKKGVVKHLLSTSEGTWTKDKPFFTALLVLKLEGCPHRRIDLVLSRAECWAHVLLNWSGSTLFLRSLSEYAKKHSTPAYINGKLGLEVVGKRDRDGKPVLLICKSEEDIFENLGLEYIPPEERNS